MKHIKITAAAIALAAFGSMGASAKTDASDSLVNNYMRSSIYTILVNSEAQNARLDKEANDPKNQDAILSLTKSLAKTDAKKAQNETETGSLASLPMKEFLTIPIPDQFNDHNLEARVLDFDAIKATLTSEEKKAYGPSKNQQAGKFMKGLAGGLLGGTAGKQESSMLHVDEVDELLPAVIAKYFKQNNTAAGLLAKWYNYQNPETPENWDLNLVTERGRYNFTPDELAKASTDQAMMNKVNQTAFDMINNTYVVALNLRFRSNQAVAAEAAALAKSVGGMFGSIGSLAASVAGTAGAAAAGDGFTVQAVSRLYKLKWNDDLNQRFATEIFEKNATIEDLIASGLCELEFIGQDKGSAGVRQSLFSDKPMSSLVKRATARAIDAAIAKLQAKNEVFRTVTPVLDCDADGTLYAAIGTKEGLGEKDEYEILEAQEDEKGRRTYKSVGTVKPVKGQIWENRFGAEEEAAENAANAKGKNKDFNDESVKLGRSAFKGKKGDYKGYFIRLKKKK